MNPYHHCLGNNKEKDLKNFSLYSKHHTDITSTSLEYNITRFLQRTILAGAEPEILEKGVGFAERANK